MRKYLFCSVCIILTLTSCSKKGSSPVVNSNTISATIDGVDESFNTIAVAKNISVSQGYSLFFAGTNGTSSTADAFSITVDGLQPITTGTFDLSGGASGNYFPGMAYTQPGSIIYEQDLSGANPTIVTITTLTATNVQGSFSGKLVLYSGSGVPATKTITNGKFNVSFR